MKPPNTPEMNIYISTEELLNVYKTHSAITAMEGLPLESPALIRVKGHMGVPDYEKFKSELNKATS